MPLADQNQISSLSFLSKDPNLMLDQVNSQLEVNSGKLSELINYKDDIILVNKSNKLLINQLNKLGFNIVEIELPTNKTELINVILDISSMTGKPNKARLLINQLQDKGVTYNKTILGFAEQGVVYKDNPSFDQLVRILAMKNIAYSLKLPLSNKLNIEQLLMINSDLILLISYSSRDYSRAFAMLHHDAINWKLKYTETKHLDSRYVLCFDQGIWQGAEVLLDE